MGQIGARRAHEREIVTAAARSVCAAWGIEYRGIDFPEDWKPQPERPIDGLVSTSGPTIKVEHTEHQSFPQEITQSKWFEPLIEMVQRISGTLPGPGRYTLHVEGAALEGHKGTNLEGLEQWIRRAVPNLTIGRRSVTATNVASATTPDVPFPVTLLRAASSSRHPDGELTVRWSVDVTAMPALNLDEMRRALGNKLPKLDEHQPKGGCTLLVLENRDLQLPSHDTITDAIRAALAEQPDLPLPDAIVVVDEIGTDRTLTFIKDSDRWYDDVPDTVELDR